MEVHMEVIGEARLKQAFDMMQEKLREAASAAAEAAAVLATGFAKNNFRTQGEWTHSTKNKKGKWVNKYAALGGPIAERLTSRTGRLRSSINAQGDGPGRAIIGSNVEYARIHELGGKIEMKHQTRLKSVRKLSVSKSRAQGAASRIAFVKAHERQAYTIEIPARPYLRPAVEQHQEELHAVIVRTLRRKLGLKKDGGGA